MATKKQKAENLTTHAVVPVLPEGAADIDPLDPDTANVEMEWYCQRCTQRGADLEAHPCNYAGQM